MQHNELLSVFSRSQNRPSAEDEHLSGQVRTDSNCQSEVEPRSVPIRALLLLFGISPKPWIGERVSNSLWATYKAESEFYKITADNTVHHLCHYMCSMFMTANNARFLQEVFDYSFSPPLSVSSEAEREACGFTACCVPHQVISVRAGICQQALWLVLMGRLGLTGPPV